MRAIILASILACLPLFAEETTCPLCGKKGASFENSPQGALRKFQFAIIARDETLFREATRGLDDESRKKFLDGNPRRWEVARWIVQECKLDGDHATLTMAKPGDEGRRELRLLREGGAWKVEFSPNEVNPQAELAKVALRELVIAEGVVRQADSDRIGAQDYWTKDIAAFYYMKNEAGKELKSIDLSLAMADRMGLGAWSKEPAAPKDGYWFRGMKTSQDGEEYVMDVDGDGVASTHPCKFAFCAYPAEYGKGGTLTYIVNEDGVVYGKDLGPDAKEGIDTWPCADPTTKGWMAIE